MEGDSWRWFYSPELLGQTTSQWLMDPKCCGPDGESPVTFSPQVFHFGQIREAPEGCERANRVYTSVGSFWLDLRRVQYENFRKKTVLKKIAGEAMPEMKWCVCSLAPASDRDFKVTFYWCSKYDMKGCMASSGTINSTYFSLGNCFVNTQRENLAMESSCECICVVGRAVRINYVHKDNRAQVEACKMNTRWGKLQMCWRRGCRRCWVWEVRPEPIKWCVNDAVQNLSQSIKSARSAVLLEELRFKGIKDELSPKSAAWRGSLVNWMRAVSFIALISKTQLDLLKKKKGFQSQRQLIDLKQLPARKKTFD